MTRRSERTTGSTMADQPQADVSTFQGLILALQQYWAEQGCVVVQPLDMEVGAGTFHPSTFLRAIGPENWNSAYVQPSRRPTDGRYGENPNRLQHYYQFQVVLKPSRTTSRSCTWIPCAGWASIRSPTTSASSRTTGNPHPGRLGPGLGNLAGRHGGDPVHLLPAGRWHRLLPGHRRADLRPGTPGHVSAGRGFGLRPGVVQGPVRHRDLRRRLPAERGGDVHLQL